MNRLSMTSWRVTLWQACKVALGAAVSILASALLGLESGMTAGIIAILSIQGTKRDTWRFAAERLLAFVCAVAIAAVCFALMGYTLPGFVAYLLVFAALCVCTRWMHALAMISVLITHFVAAGRMDAPLLLNEALLLVIGAGCGMLVNLHLRPDPLAMRRLADEMDGQMVAALRALAASGDPVNQDVAAQEACFTRLLETLEKAHALAIRNRENSLTPTDTDNASYVQLRKSQCRVLMQIRDAMRDVTTYTPQYTEVCAFMNQVADEYHRLNDVSTLLRRRAQLLEHMKSCALPATREEFESRAMLYQVLTRMEDFLMLKRAYIMSQRMDGSI
ncbi:MAG: aromatic acid exporter family protein [bacterium]|nr:aromatic acid exporter family protein [bacterium]